MADNVRKLFMSHEEFERLQQQQQQQQPPPQQQSPPPPAPTDNVMRFFQNFGLNNSQEQQPQQPSSPSPSQQQPNIFSFLSNEIKNNLTSSPTISPSTSTNNLNGSHSSLSSSFGNLITKSFSNNSINQANQANQNQNLIHNGLYLYGKNIKINSSESLDSKFEVESQTVTVIQSTRNSSNSLGNLITFNKNFISYVVKGEKVRILDRSSSNKVLLKDFPDVVDIQFHSEDVNIISCCSMGNGSIYVYELINNIQTLEDAKLLAKIPPPPNSPEKTYYTTVKWHPTKPDILLTCTNNSKYVYAFNIYNSSSPLFILETPSSTLKNNEIITGLDWSTDGNSISICNKEYICIFSNNSSNNNSQPQLECSFKNTNDEFKDGFLYVNRISENNLVAVTSQSEIILFSIPNFQVIQRITFSTNLFTNYSLFTIKNSFIFISDNNSSKLYIIHINNNNNNNNDNDSDIPHFDFINECEFKRPIISFCFQSSPSSITNNLGSSKGSSIQQQQQENEKDEVSFCACTIQAGTISLHSIILDGYYSEDHQYTSNNSTEIIEQIGNYNDNINISNNSNSNNIDNSNNNIINNDNKSLINEPLSPISSSTNATVGSEDDDKLNTLTPKLFVQPSSPPPLSLPEPDLTCSPTNNDNTTAPNNIDTSAAATTATTKVKKESSKVPKKKSSSSTTSPTPTISTTPIPNTSSNITEEAGSTSPVTSKKKSSKSKVSSSSSSESLSQDGKEVKEKSSTPSKSSKSSTTTTTTTQSTTTPTTASTTTTPSTTTPTTTSTTSTPTKSKNVTPSFIPPVLNIPLSNPVSSKQPGSKSKDISTSTNVSNSPPQSQATTTTVQTQQEKPSSSPQQTSQQSVSNETISPIIYTGSSNEQLFKEMENRLLNKIQQSINQLEKERQEREQIERERQEKLLTVVHQSVTTMVKANLEKVVKKEIANTFINLEKTLPAVIESTVSKLTQEQMKKLSVKTDILLKSSSEAIVNNVKNVIVSDALEGMIKPQMESVFLSYFQNVLIPGFEKSCQSMFTHLSYTFENGFNQSIQHQTLNAQGQHLALEKILNENTTILKECTQSLNDQQSNLSNEFKKQQEKQQLFNQQLQQQIQQLQQQLQHFPQQPQSQSQPPFPNQPSQHMHQPSQQPPFSPQPSFTNLHQMNMAPMGQPPSPFGYNFPPHPNMNMGISSPNEFQHLQQPLSPQQPQQQQISPTPSPQPQSQQQQSQQQQQQNKVQQQQLINQKLASYPQLKALVETNYIDAFNFALNASNLQMVVNLCSSLDPATVLSSMKFPQTIILSLIQQLSINLTTDTELKLKWIKDCLFFVDNSKADVTKKILKLLKTKLDDPQISSTNQHLLQQIKFMIKDV